MSEPPWKIADERDRGFADQMALVLRLAPPLELSLDLVDSVFDSSCERARSAELQFRAAFKGTLASLPLSDRAPGLNGVTGHIAESVVESMLVNAGWTPLEHFTGPLSGGHGIDLAMLSPDFSSVFVIEVKGTLQRRRWPTLTRSEIDQMSPDWLSQSGNVGMLSVGAGGNDVSGLVVAVQFARRQWKGVVTLDFSEIAPIIAPDQLEDLSWLT